VRLRNKLLSLAVGALALLGVSGSAMATTVTLASLVAPGATLTSDDGTLTFSGFSANISGALSTNLANYNVQSLANGFRITGAFLVADGNIGDLVLGYTATASQGLQITEVKLFANATFNPKPAPPGLAAGVSETVFSGGNPIGILSVAATSQGFADLTDSATLAPPVNTITVLKDIALTSSSGGQGSAAHISVVDQTFTVTPEPGTLLLGSAGLLGIAAIGRKRVR
jgi:hypothetical protein